MLETTPADLASEKAQEKSDSEAADPSQVAKESMPPAPSSGQAPQESAPPPSGSGSSTFASDYDPRIPPHHYFKPQWAVSLQASARALGDLGGYLTRGFSVLFEFQPRVLQKIGVLSVGPSISIYPVSDSKSLLSNGGKITSSVYSVWSVGGIARYQARWFRNQWIVPTIGYAYDRIAYRPSGAPSGVTTQQGPVFGAMLLLNALDPDTAASSYADPGIVRSYLFAEMKRPKGGDATLAVRSSVYQFGLRIEF